MRALRARPLIRPRSEKPLHRPVWWWGVFVSLSLASGFQPGLWTPSRRPLPQQVPPFAPSLGAVTDPEVLLHQIADSEAGEWTEADRQRVELLYKLTSTEEGENETMNAKKKTRRVKMKRRTQKSLPNNNNHQNTDSETLKSTELPTQRIQFRGLSTTARRRPRSEAASRRRRSSTMPGFAAESGRQRDYREGLRLYERRTGTKIVETQEQTTKRRKQQGEAMYRNSASVPDSLVQFADEIHQEDRISRKEEIELGTKTQEAIRLQHLYTSLEETLDREPTDEEWCAAAGKINMEAIRLAIEDGLEAKNKLVTANLRLVQSVVNTYIRNGLTGEYNAGDMMQEGILALIRAAEKFEPDRGWKFSTYAMYWVRASVKRNQVAQTRVVSVPHRLYENNKRLKKIEVDLARTLERRPTRKELAEASGLTEDQIERCLTAMAQRSFSLDTEISNQYKPMSISSSRDRLVDILDTKSEDSEERKLDSHLLREDIIEALNRYLTPEEVELLLFRYGLKELPQSKSRIGSQPTIAELSRVLGLKPDKIRRTINRALKHLRAAGAEEMLSYQRDLL